MGTAVVPGLTAGGYAGKIYPVNRGYQEIDGHTCYPSVEDIPAPVDHCIIAIGREQVAGVLEQCRRKNVGGVSIWSSGFAELDDAGSDAQSRLRQLAGDMPFLGPNCMGFANLGDKIFATSAALTLARNCAHGDLALLSQSGGLAFATICTFAEQRKLPFSYVVNTGNTAGISFGDLLEFMFHDESTRLILAVIESDAVVAQVIARVRRLGLRKPIVMLKLGRGRTGTRMAQSHTGSLAGDYRATRDCAEQIGIVCVDDVDELLDAAELLRSGLDGRNADQIAALSISGGNITLFADHADAQNLTFAALTPATETKLRSLLPDYISVHNPIDITGLGVRDHALHAGVMQALVEDPGVRTVVPILTTLPSYVPTCTMLADLKSRSGRAIVVLWTGGSFETESAQILRNSDIPIFHLPGRLAAALSSVRRATVDPEQPLARRSDVPKLPQTSGPLTEGDALAFIEANGVPVPRWQRCHKDTVNAAARDVGFPLVIKADLADTHISDRGGVILDVTGDDDLARRERQIAGLPGERLLVSRYLPGTELIVSTFRHPSFGRLMMVGSGGQLVELVSDVRFVAVPARPAELERALLGTAAGRLLKAGHRNATGFEAALDLLQKVNTLASALADDPIQIELNPVTVGMHGAVAVDAAIVAAP